VPDFPDFAPDWASAAAGFIVDLDGTLITGRSLMPHAVGLLERLKGRFVIVSNDGEHVPAQVGRMLSDLGLPVAAERIVLAGTETLDLIAAERPGAEILLLGSDALRAYAYDIGLRLAGNAPEVVVVGRDRRFSYARLTVAVNAVRAGAELIATNADHTHPGPDGSVVPETGALLAAILHCVGSAPHRVIGKPEPALFTKALRILDVPAASVAVIGDNPTTDGIGARRLGMRYIEVRNGRLAAAAMHSTKVAASVIGVS